MATRPHCASLDEPPTTPFVLQKTDERPSSTDDNSSSSGSSGLTTPLLAHIVTEEHPGATPAPSAAPHLCRSGSVSWSSNSVDRAVAAFRNLARRDSVDRARTAFRMANKAVLQGAEQLSYGRRASFTNRGALTPSKELQPPEAGLGRLQVAITVWSGLMGTGIVALPYALATVGWWGLALICGCAVVTAYTGKLLAWSLETVNGRKRRMPERFMGEGFVCTYDQLAQEVLGPSGGILMQVLTLLECLGSAVCLIVLQAANWPTIVDLQTPGWLSPSFAVALASGALCYGLLTVDGRALSRLGAGCHLLAGALFLVQFVVLLLLPPPAGAGCSNTQLAKAPQLISHAPSAAAGAVATGQAQGGVGVALGVVLFCFTGHASLPELYRQMRADERRHFERAVDLGYAASCACFCAFAAAGCAPRAAALPRRRAATPPRPRPAT